MTRPLRWLPLQLRLQGQHRLRVLRLLLHALPSLLLLLLLPRLAARLLAARLAVLQQPWPPQPRRLQLHRRCPSAGGASGCNAQLQQEWTGE